ncbi:hypothetical protein D3C78_1908290 [compost metagenome]
MSLMSAWRKDWRCRVSSKSLAARMRCSPPSKMSCGSASVSISRTGASHRLLCSARKRVVKGFSVVTESFLGAGVDL